MNEKIMLWEGKAPYTADSPDGFQPSITTYKVEGSKGAVVVVPGGGYHVKAPHEGGPIAEMINEAGVSAFVLDYRVAPCNTYAPLSDAKRAIRMVKNMGYEKVAILGFSAGGHLTCTAATMYDMGNPDAEDPIDRISSRPDAFIPCYPVVSFGAYRHQGSMENLLGEENKNNYALIRQFSNELHITKDTPEAFIWHTASDEAVPVENSINLAAAMSAQGVPFEMHIFPAGRHGLGLADGIPDVCQWTKLLHTWLKMRNYN